MATIPTLLYYLALFLMVEIDARKFGMRDVAFERVDTVWNLSKRYWFHFLSLISIVVFMLWGFSPVLSVFWATVVALVTSFLRRDTALFSYDLFRGKGSVKRHLLDSGFAKAMEGGSLGVLNVAATCAGAGIIVGVVTLTGLGLKFSSIVIDYAGGSLLLTAIFTSLVVWIVGLGGAGDGLVHHLRGDRRAGADQARRARFRGAHVHLLLRGAVGGLAADRAVALRRRGDHRRRSLQDHAAVLEVHRAGVPGAVHVRARPGRPGPAADGLDQGAGRANWWSIAEVTLTAAVGIAALAGGFQGWALKRATPLERVMLIVAGFALVYPTALADAVGFLLVLAVLAMQYFLRRGPDEDARTAPGALDHLGRGAGQAARACVLRPTLAGNHRGTRSVTSSTRPWSVTALGTANGSCARTPEPPAPAPPCPG